MYYVIGSYVLDRMLSVNRSLYATVVFDGEVDVGRVRNIFRIPKNIGLNLIDNVQNSLEGVVVFDSDKFIMNEDCVVLNENGKVIHELKRVDLITKIDNPFKAAKIIYIAKNYPELNIDTSVKKEADKLLKSKEIDGVMLELARCYWG
jgi:AAA+ ATPase superfamily predicted ATPase